MLRLARIALLVCSAAGCAAGGPGSARVPFIDGSFALTPGDSALVFAYHADGASALYRADTDGRTVRLVAAPERSGYYLNPAVSPDGHLVAFVGYRGDDFSRGSLHVVPLAGGTPREIPTGVRTVTEAAFSRDGRHVYVLAADVYRRTRGPAGDYATDLDLYVVGTDGTGLRRLTAFDAAVMEGLAVVGDPERVVVRLGQEPGDAGSVVFLDPSRPDAPVPVWTPHDGLLLVDNAAVSPDGRRVAYTDANRRAGLFVIDIAAQQSRPVPLPDFPMVQSIRWTHRGDALVFFRYGYEERSGPTRVEMGTPGFTDVRIDPADVLAARDAAR